MAGRKIIDRAGQKFNMLTGIRYVRPERRPGKDSRANQSIWLWQCDCGKQVEYTVKEVVYNKRPRYSCGCTHKVKKRFGIQAIVNRTYLHYVADSGDLTFERFLELAEANCTYCGAEPTNQAKQPKMRDKGLTWTYNGIDRLYSDQPHNMNNCITCCWVCNQMKRAMGYELFILSKERFNQ